MKGYCRFSNFPIYTSDSENIEQCDPCKEIDDYYYRSLTERPACIPYSFEDVIKDGASTGSPTGATRSGSTRSTASPPKSNGGVPGGEAPRGDRHHGEKNVREVHQEPAPDAGAGTKDNKMVEYWYCNLALTESLVVVIPRYEDVGGELLCGHPTALLIQGLIMESIATGCLPDNLSWDDFILMVKFDSKKLARMRNVLTALGIKMRVEQGISENDCGITPWDKNYNPISFRCSGKYIYGEPDQAPNVTEKS